MQVSPTATCSEVFEHHGARNRDQLHRFEQRRVRGDCRHRHARRRVLAGDVFQQRRRFFPTHHRRGHLQRAEILADRSTRPPPPRSVPRSSPRRPPAPAARFRSLNPVSDRIHRIHIVAIGGGHRVRDRRDSLCEVPFTLNIDIKLTGPSSGSSLALTSVSMIFNPAPEPVSISIFGVSLAALAVARRFRRKRGPTLPVAAPPFAPAIEPRA